MTFAPTLQAKSFVVQLHGSSWGLTSVETRLERSTGPPARLQDQRNIIMAHIDNATARSKVAAMEGQFEAAAQLLFEAGGDLLQLIGTDADTCG